MSSSSPVPPGAGKTTVARLLAAEAERAVHLEADWFFDGVIEQLWTQFAELGPLERHAIQTENLTPSEVARLLGHRLHAGELAA